MDLDILAGRLEAAEAKPVERVFLNEGTTVIRIDGMLCRESQKGQNFCILEATVVSSDVYAPETPVKQMWALSGVDKWRIDANLSIIKAVIQAAKPGKPLDGVAIKAAVTGGPGSSIAGCYIKATAIERTSDRGKSYKDWSYSYVKEIPAPAQPVAETVSEQLDATFGTQKSPKNTDDLPNFEM